MSNRLPISCFIIAKNEADRIGRAIDSVREFVDEVIVVLDPSTTDETAEVARRHGAEVVTNAWAGYGPQKRFGEDRCRNTWLLNLDADEAVTPELRAEIVGLFANGEPQADGYKIAIVDLFPGEERPSRFAYRLSPVRLYRRDRGRYADSPVHDRVAFSPDARISRLKGIIHHRSIRSLGDQISKLDRYSTMQAEDFVARGRRLPTVRVYGEFPAAFLKAWIGRRLFLRGTYGFLIAMNYAIFRHMRVAKIYERSENTPSIKR
jgi:glycosyltransferase involved in cell wall biosynthesis